MKIYGGVIFWKKLNWSEHIKSVYKIGYRLEV